MAENIAYYAKLRQWGAPFTFYRGDNGAELACHIGGDMVCPRCGGPILVAAEQIMHSGDPHSIGHGNNRLDRNIAGENTWCGAHFVTADPEEPATIEEVARDHPTTADALRRVLGDRLLFKRPINWHGDVGPR